MTDAVLPKAFGDKVALLGPTQFPFGDGCKLSREVQALAFHYGLTKENVDVMESIELLAIMDFPLADPDGDDEQQEVFRFAAAVFKSPIVKRKVTMMVRRGCCADPFAQLVLPSGPAPPKKKAKTSGAVSGVDASASSAVDPSSSAGGATVAAAAATSDTSTPVPAVSGAAAPSGVKSSSKVDSSDSSSSDDDDDDDGADASGDAGAKASKSTDKLPKDAYSMVAEISSKVSFSSYSNLRACVEMRGSF